jgi:integrase
MKFLFSSGLRIGEACGLTEKNIDLDKGKGKVIRSTTKSKAGVRDFFFDKKLSDRILI